MYSRNWKSRNGRRKNVATFHSKWNRWVSQSRGQKKKSLPSLSFVLTADRWARGPTPRKKIFVFSAVATFKWQVDDSNWHRNSVWFNSKVPCQRKPKYIVHRHKRRIGSKSFRCGFVATNPLCRRRLCFFGPLMFDWLNREKNSKTPRIRWMYEVVYSSKKKQVRGALVEKSRQIWGEKSGKFVESFNFWNEGRRWRMLWFFQIRTDSAKWFNYCWNDKFTECGQQAGGSNKKPSSSNFIHSRWFKCNIFLFTILSGL